jgi:hypothetical protein
LLSFRQRKCETRNKKESALGPHYVLLFTPDEMCREKVFPEH